MGRRWLLVSIALAVAIAAAVLVVYRADMRSASSAASEGGLVSQTSAGAVEYADLGAGPPLLSVHGSGGGYDQGLANALSLAGDGFRIIAPSRFGYLGTAVREDSSADAQADAHAALLDAIGVEWAVVMGASAGARSALRLAIRHPARVAALVLVVPATYSPQEVGAQVSRDGGFPIILELATAGADFVWWAVERVAPSFLVRFIGVPPELLDVVSAQERARVLGMVHAVQPLSRRFAGIGIDSVPDLEMLPLDEVRVPTLVISARDDLFDTLPPAEFIAERMPQARLIVYQDGGHLLAGHADEVRQAVRAFIEEALLLDAVSP